MDIQIIVDSCCDLTPALRNLLRVSVASLKIDVGASTMWTTSASTQKSSSRT